MQYENINNNNNNIIIIIIIVIIIIIIGLGYNRKNVVDTMFLLLQSFEWQTLF